MEDLVASKYQQPDQLEVKYCVGVALLQRWPLPRHRLIDIYTEGIDCGESAGAA